MLVVLLVLILLAAAYILSVRGRKGHPGLKLLQGWSYAHRGLHDENRPENSMAAFRAAKEKGYGVELDIHLLADGNLAVIHDSLLKRTTGAEGSIEELTTEQLSQYSLEGTEETIPTLQQVLELFDGQVPLIVELKAENGNHAALCQEACRQLAESQGAYCMESFDPFCVHWLKKNRPEIVRGQLSSNFMKAKKPKSWLLRFVVTNQLENFLTLPDFTAYRFSNRKNLSNFIIRRLWGVQGVTWTLCSKEEYDIAVQEGWIPIFENFEP